MRQISITELETAINHWRTRRPAVDAAACPEVSCLGDVYGAMIYRRATSVSYAELNDAQKDALRILDPISLSLP